MKRSGSIDSLIVFKALGDVQVVFPIDLNKGWRWSTLYNNYLVVEGFDISGSESPTFIQGDYNQIKNCKIHDCTEDGLVLAGGSNNSFTNNQVYNTGWNGIYIECRPDDGAKGNADFNIVEHNTSYNNLNHFGINIFPNTAQPQVALTGNIIRYNKVYNNLGGIYLRNFKDGFIYGNIIYDNYNNGIFLHHLDSSQTSSQFQSNLKIYNNTLVNNTPYNSINNVSFTDVEIKNNIFIQQSANPSVKSDHTQNIEIDYNLYHNPSSVFVIKWGTENLRLSTAQGYGLELNGIESNPLLGLDFKGSSTSPALDNGIDLGKFFIMDPEGNFRGDDGAWDMGAFEGYSNLISSAKIKIMLEGAYLNARMQTTLNDS
ncbi:MAG: right-handed parallel beta-helix repeat-containing protein, partial [Nitrososphaeraceae archaeon]|nr:right-handed parallel beta-helix repeat-containing protein [Nitrososphaeraceae archaeon]